MTKLLMGLCIAILFLANCGTYLDADDRNMPMRADVIMDGDAPVTFNSLADLEAMLRVYPASFNAAVPAVQGGTLTLPLLWNHHGMQANVMLTGMMHQNFAGNQHDQIISHIINPNLFPADAYGRLILGDNHHGSVIVTLDASSQTLIFTMREGVVIRWHDGVELTMEDLYYAITFFASLRPRLMPDHPYYQIQGFNAVARGDAETISGLSLSDNNQTLSVAFDEMHDLMFYIAWMGIPLPRHIFAPMEDPVEIYLSPFSRDAFVGFGPFMIERIVPGEYVLLRANPDYWQGRPKLDYLRFVVTEVSDALTMLLNSELDAADISFAQYQQLSAEEDINILGMFSATQQLLYFNLGAMTSEMLAGGRRSVPTVSPRTDNHPIMNREFRRAVSYAIDRMHIDMVLGHGIARSATSIIHPYRFHGLIDPNDIGMSVFDLDRANEILDAAGFAWSTNGLRTDPDGNYFQVNMAMSDSPTSQMIFSMHQANLRAIGINMQKHEGIINPWMSQSNIIREAQSQRVNHDMHMFLIINNITHLNPIPSYVWGNNTANNLGAFTSPDFQSVIERFSSEAIWDAEFFDTAMRDWARLFDYYVPAITGSWELQLSAVNNRVVNWSVGNRGAYVDGARQWHAIGVTD